MSVSGTGDWDAYEEMSTSVSGLSGVKDLYLRFTGPVNFDNFVFSTGGGSNTPPPNTNPPNTNPPSYTNPPVQGSLGDINGDNNVDSTDYALLKRHILGTTSLAGNALSKADTNGDGSVDSTDYALIKRYILGLITVFPGQSAVTTRPPVTTPPSVTTPPANKVIKILPLGDSITDGLTVPGGYRIKLWKHITDNGYKVDFVGSMSNGPSELGDKNHEGHSGWTVSQIDTNINSWMDKYTPQIVLLHIGTNDIYMSPNGASDRLSVLIDKICAKLPSDGKLYVSNIIPLSMSDVTAYNSKIPGIVQQKTSAGKPVYFVEMYKALTTSDLADGVHPNATGYNKMADVWFNAIRDDLAK